MSKTILVTGSAKGIGSAIIKEFASKGYNCVINYNTSVTEALKLKEEIEASGVKCLSIKADITDEDAVSKMFEEIEDTFGGVDILVNNAAVDNYALFPALSTEDFKKTIDVNVIGAYNTAKKAYKYMINNKWGRIINIASTNGINTYYPDTLAYDASKAALISLTHNLAVKFSPYVNVNAIAPGFIGTEAELDGYDDDFLKAELEKVLVKRYGKACEVAILVYFLASDDADFINNTVIRIDGGQYGSI